jgi:hypothetical protein
MNDDKINRMKTLLTEIKRVLEDGADGAVVDTVWSDTMPNQTIVEMIDEELDNNQ